MSDRSERISRLKADRKARESYINSKISVLVPSQIKALRLKSQTPQQTALARAAGTQQSRLSNLEKPGESNVTLETLAWIASIHKVGLIVKFVPFSEMLKWENSYSQDAFNVTRLESDEEFLNPRSADTSTVRIYSGEVQSPRVRDVETVVARTKVPSSDPYNQFELVANG